MTVTQIRGFLEAINRKKAKDYAFFVSNVATGAQGSSKGIQKTIKSYLKEG